MFFFILPWYLYIVSTVSHEAQYPQSIVEGDQHHVLVQQVLGPAHVWGAGPDDKASAVEVDHDGEPGGGGQGRGVHVKVQAVLNTIVTFMSTRVSDIFCPIGICTIRSVKRSAGSDTRETTFKITLIYKPF